MTLYLENRFLGVTSWLWGTSSDTHATALSVREDWNKWSAELCALSSPMSPLWIRNKDILYMAVSSSDSLCLISLLLIAAPPPFFFLFYSSSVGKLTWVFRTPRIRRAGELTLSSTSSPKTELRLHKTLQIQRKSSAPASPHTCQLNPFVCTHVERSMTAR